MELVHEFPPPPCLDLAAPGGRVGQPNTVGGGPVVGTNGAQQNELVDEVSRNVRSNLAHLIIIIIFIQNIYLFIYYIYFRIFIYLFIYPLINRT